MPKYYAHITGEANVSVPFNPYQVYTGNGNYLRLEVNCDNLRTDSTRNNGAVWINSASGWFSFEMYGQGWEYLNLGGTTYIGRYNYWSTNGFEETFVVEMNNGNVTLTKGEQTSATTFSNNFSNANISFFPTRTGANTRVNFYEWKAYGANNTLLFDFVPDYSGTTMGLRDKVSGEFYAATDQTKIELIALSTFEIQPEEESALYTSGTTTITLSADEGLTWTASTTDNWLTLSTSTGTGSANITLSYTENKAPQPREGIVTFTSSEGDVLTYTITQDKRPLFIYNRPIYRSGSIVKKMYRSGELIYVRIGDAPIPPLPTGLTDYVGWFEDNFNDIASGGSMFNKIYVNTGLTTENESFALLGTMTGEEYTLSFNNGVFSVNNTAVTATTSLQGNDYYVYDFGERLYVESISPVTVMVDLRNSAMSFYQTEGVVAIYIEEKDCSNSYSEWGYESTEDCNCQKYGVDCGGEEDICEDWENMGYVDYEDCRCGEYGECMGDPCDNWESDGYGSYEECQCLINGGTWDGESCVEDSGDECENWEDEGYSSYEDCRCDKYGECGDPEEE